MEPVYQCDSFWRNYETSMKWMHNYVCHYEIEYLKHKAASLQYENEMLRARGAQIPSSSDLTSRFTTREASSVDGSYDEASVERGEYNVEDKFEFVVDEGMIEFLELSMKHKEARRKESMAELTNCVPKRKNVALENILQASEFTKINSPSSEEGTSSALGVMPESSKRFRRYSKWRRRPTHDKFRRWRKTARGSKKAAKNASPKNQQEEIISLGMASSRSKQMQFDLYGKDAQKIMGMETALHLNFHEVVSTNKPAVWPVIELNM